MDYCLDAGDGTAAIWTAEPNVDLDGDGVFDGIRLDLDGDGGFDDGMFDSDSDGWGDYAALDLNDDGTPEARFTDDGSGGWALGGAGSPAPRWFGLDGAEHSGGVADVDDDGVADRLFDVDRDGLADRALLGPADEAARSGYADINGDGRWDLMLSDADGDGHADSAAAV